MDNYTITAASIKEPPASFSSKFAFLGPGFILSASIVGSGELIATTILGARAGFVMFWIIIVSCVVKTAIQLQFGKQAILTGETVMSSFNRLPGPRFFRTGWPVWMVLLLTLLKVIQIGGMLGGSAIVLSMLFPGTPVMIWAPVLAVAAALLIFKNYYRLVERSSLVMIGFFTVMTLLSLVAVTFTPYRFSFSDILSGLQFTLPSELVLFAIGAFGITGVGSDEILAYNYWCLEKGYAAYAGPRDNSEAWKKRAKGWISVMYLDAVVAMIIYTTVTAAFYLLGASILYGSGETPEGNGVIEVLAKIYTESLGGGIRTAFLIGAFFVLFSSVFATLAYWSRLFSDIFGQIGWMDFHNTVQRRKMIAVLAWVFPAIWAVAFLFIELPVIMIISGGIVGSVLLLLVVYAALNFRYRNERLLPESVVFDLFLWLSVISILVIAVYGLIQLL